VNRLPPAPCASRTGAAGFTLIEIMVVVAILGLLYAIVVPNLGAFLPKTRLDKEARVLSSNIDMMRSEARIQSKRLTLQLDLKKARWRRVQPPEQQLTTDQDAWTLEEHFDEWTELEHDVVYAGAGDTNEIIARNSIYSIVFDENGFTGDQVVMFRLESDPTMIWSVQIHGLTGECEIVPDFDGHEHPLEETGEGAF
jgi:type II secretion system protein H